MFIVIALHNTGHGEAATPIFLTNDLACAVASTRTAETSGYEFYAEDTYVGVCQLEPERAYEKKKIPWIFIRRRSNGAWEEEWIDKMFETRV